MENPFETDDIIFYLFDILKTQYRVKQIVKLTLLNRHFNRIGTLSRYELPEIKFFKKIVNESSRNGLLLDIEYLFKNLCASEILNRHISKSDEDIVIFILEKKYFIDPNDNPFVNKNIDKIIDIIDAWCYTKLDYPPQRIENSSFELVEKLFMKLYKYLVRYSMRLLIDNSKAEPLVTEQLLIKSSVYSFNMVDNIFNIPRAHFKFFYVIDILCYIKIIYHATLYYASL